MPTRIGEIKEINFISDDKLCESLNKKSSDVYLVDNQHYEDLQTYSVTPKGKRVQDLKIKDLYNRLFRGQKFSIAYLKTKRISLFDNNSQQIDEWTLYKCLFTQFSLNIGGHILYKGNWYEIQKRFLQDLKDFIS